MGAGHLREKAADYLRLARGLSSHSPTRRHLIVMAERLERQAKEIDKHVDAAAAQPRDGRQDKWQDQASDSENDDREL
ncbi:MAG: hypothetical protein J2P55_03560 [Rhizobiales bacterium]|nr:hypothetical protein [Hyphomicrobiales bacterium]